MQEVDIEKVDTSIVTNGAIEEKATDEVAGALEVPKVIIRAPMPENIIMYNQLNVDPYACTIVATFTAISNLLNVRFSYQISYQNMINVLNNMKADGKFTSKVGAYLQDAIDYSLVEIEKQCGKKVKSHKILLTLPAVLEGLKHSCVVTGIKYGKGYVQDEQDNARVDNIGSIGAQGHAVSFCKANTEQDHLVKFIENYDGKDVAIN